MSEPTTIPDDTALLLLKPALDMSLALVPAGEGMIWRCTATLTNGTVYDVVLTAHPRPAMTPPPGASA